MANTQELMLRIRGDNTDAERKISQTGKSVQGFNLTTQKASAAMRTFGRDLLQVRDASDLVSAATRALGSVIAGSLAGTAVVVAGKALIDAYRNVSKAVDETRTSLEAAKKAAGGIGLGAGLAESTSAANSLFAESDKAFQKINEINKSKLQLFIASITGATEEMARLGEEAKSTAQKILTTGVINERQARIIVQGFSDIDKEAEKAGKQYDDLIVSARRSGDAQLENQLILEKRIAVEQSYVSARKRQEKELADELKKVADERAKSDADIATQNEINEIKRQRDLERTRKELEQQVRINEERLRQEKQMSEESQMMARFERSGAVYSGRGGRTRFDVRGANEAALQAGRGALESTRAGQQALEVARRQREREVAKENFRIGNRLTADQRKSMAAQIAASEMPTLEQRAGGQERLNNSIERLISIIGSAPLVTSGAGSN